MIAARPLKVRHQVLWPWAHVSLLGAGLQRTFLVAASLFALAVGNVAPLDARAQEISATSTGTLPSRIVIAPARTDLARAIKAKLRSERQDQVPDALARYYFYGARGFEPLWIDRFGGGEYAQSLKALDVRNTLTDAASWGLDPASYAISQASSANPEAAAELELAITSAAVRYAWDTFGGRIDPRSLSGNLDMDRPRIDIRDLLQKLAGSDRPGGILEAFAPDSLEFVELRRRLATLDDAPETAEAIPAGDSIKPGSSDPRVVLLRNRLGVSPPPGDQEGLYDDALVEAVKAFQVEYQLTPDGIVGNATRSALNRSVRLTRGQILANMEKWRWLPRDLGDFYVQVNIPEYRLWIKKEGEPVYETRVVVGTSKNQTPIFFDQIRHVVVNPYWNVPTSIARNEIGPQVLRDPGYLARKEMELMADGRVIDPWSVDWSSTGGGFPFQVRQKPGRQNALGQVKFLFPNKHDVYLHDTPEKSLFGADLRAFSHGCVRVQNPMEFADALLANEPKLSAQRLEAAFGPKEKWFNLEVKVPVFLTYFTVRVDGDGRLRSFDDIYGHDERIISALEQLGTV
jgi:L,D-transpeptidase YcbB